MTLRLPRALTALVLPFALIACADDDRATSSSSKNSPPEDPGPTGAVNLEIYGTELQDCPAGNVHIDIGNVSSAPPVTFEDGKDGAEVSCSVVPEAGKLRASGSIAHGSQAFSFKDVVTEGKSAIGFVTAKDPASGTIYAAPPGKPCVFQFAPNSAQGVEAGRIVVQFDCSSLVSAEDPAHECSLRYGYVLLEHCEGEPE
ncbi:MAG TPA: hypothetical protein VE093_14440 [Polyangiaceae bacterium]|jgi:hypothetical protein|nr:hypothetical protein [Polyangiaceae bacterium]